MTVRKEVVRPDEKLERQKIDIILKGSCVQSDSSNEKLKEILVGLPEVLIEEVNKQAKKKWCSRSQWIRDAIIKALKEEARDE